MEDVVCAQGALRYRLAQFTRRVRTDLACLGGGLDTLDTLAAVLGDSIDRGAAGGQSWGHYRAVTLYLVSR